MQQGMLVVPAGGGFRFMQRLPNGGYHTFLENDPEALFKVVLDFRKDNNLPIGDLKAELARGISAPILPKLQESRSLRERVTAWLVNKQFGIVKYVSPEEATKRAELAMKCPYNIVNYADECLECYNSTLRGLYAIRQGRSTKYDNFLGACKHCGYDNQTAVHLQASCLPNTTGQPRPCWCSILDTDTVREVG